MIDIVLYLIISGPLGEREIPIQSFTNIHACQVYAEQSTLEYIRQHPLSIGQKPLGSICKETREIKNGR